MAFWGHFFGFYTKCQNKSSKHIQIAAGRSHCTSSTLNHDDRKGQNKNSAEQNS